jgi:hypothetical protein
MCSPTRGHVLALFLSALAAGTGYGQGTAVLPNAPGPASLGEPTAPEPAVSPPRRIDPPIRAASIYPVGAHGPGCGGGPPACIPFEDRNGPLLIGDPLLDGPPGTPGWVAAFDLGVVVPHVKNRLTADVTLVDGTTDTVHLPAANLGVRAMPDIELGYRCGQASGELTVSYRFLVAQGNQLVSPVELPSFAPTGTALKSRLNFQVLDVDYGSYEPSLGPWWDMKWRVGVRGIMAYNDSQALNALLAEQTTNRFWGIGPHASLDLRRWVGDTGLALFGRVDTSVPWGRLTQRYIEIATAADGTPNAGETRLFQNSAIVSLGLQLGVAWSPSRSNCFRITAGYSFEQFWEVGAVGVGAPGLPRETISIQGGFLRAEWNY